METEKGGPCPQGSGLWVFHFRYPWRPNCILAGCPLGVCTNTLGSGLYPLGRCTMHLGRRRNLAFFGCKSCSRTRPDLSFDVQSLGSSYILATPFVSCPTRCVSSCTCRVDSAVDATGIIFVIRCTCWTLPDKSKLAATLDALSISTHAQPQSPSRFRQN